MAVIPASLTRTSDSLRSLLLAESLTGRVTDLTRLQQQLTSAQRVNTPSDDPIAARLILALNESLGRADQYLSNLSLGRTHLQATESAVGEMLDLVREAQSAAEQEAGPQATSVTRDATAEVVASIIDSLIAQANRSQGGTLLFGGQSGVEAPFELVESAVRYNGDDGIVSVTTDDGRYADVSLNGVDSLGAWDARVANGVSLGPTVTADTRLADLRDGEGVAPGSVIISDGTNTTTIDLSGADTVGDVITLMQADLPPTTTVTISATADGLTISSSLPGADIDVQDVPGGSTAADLGIRTAAGGSGADTVVGSDVRPTLTGLSRLDDLAVGATLDRTSGFVITNGSASAVVDIGSAETVEDLINAIDGCGCDVFARIADDGRSIEVVSRLSGVPLTIGENGGATASDLGLRSLYGDTHLADLNDGLGVVLVDGDDLTLTLSDGTVAGVDLDGAVTVQDALDLIEAAAPGQVQAEFVAVGNGIKVTDLTGGAGTFTVADSTTGHGASHLGIADSVSAPGDAIEGADVNPTTADNVFTHLLALRDALLGNDDEGIREAAEHLAADTSDLAAVQALAGARLNGLDVDENWLEEQQLVDEDLLSTTRDLDYATAVAEFATLNTLAQAAVQMAASVTRLSLLDYL